MKLQFCWCVTEYFSSMGWFGLGQEYVIVGGLGWVQGMMGWVGLRKLDPRPCLVLITRQLPNGTQTRKQFMH